MYVLINYEYMVMGVSEDLKYDDFNNPIIKHGTIGFMKEDIKQIYENVQDVPEDINEQIYYYDGTEWRVPN